MYSSREANILGALAVAVGDKLEAAEHQRVRRAVPEAALVHLSHCKNPTIASLCTVLNLTHSGAVRLADRLEEEGLARRDASERDRRATTLSLTAAGMTAVERVLASRGSAIETLMREALSAEEREILAELAGKLLRAATGNRSDLYRICRLCEFSTCHACPVDEAVTR